MSGLTKWRDTTSYSRDDRERKPTMYSIKHGRLNITITCGHTIYRPDWVMTCFAVGIVTKVITVLDRKFNNNDNLDDIKARAIEIVESRIDEIRDDIIVIKRVPPDNKNCSTCKHDGMQLVEPKCIGCNNGTITERKNWEPY